MSCPGPIDGLCRETNLPTTEQNCKNCQTIPGAYDQVKRSGESKRRREAGLEEPVEAKKSEKCDKTYCEWPICKFVGEKTKGGRFRTCLLVNGPKSYCQCTRCKERQAKVLLVHNLAPGDICMVTAAVRDIKRQYPGLDIHVSTSAIELWMHNPNVKIDRSSMNDFDAKITVNYGGDGKGIQRSNQDRDKHFAHAMIEDLNLKLGLRAVLTKTKPDLHLSEAEGRLDGLPDKYWVIVAGGKRDILSKIWFPERFQEVVEKTPEISWVQAGSRENSDHVHISLKNVTDMVGKTRLREFLRLIAYSEGVVCGVTFPMHVAAAFDKKCVVIAGGREPYWWEHHEGHTYIHACETLDCCKRGGCWKGDCVNLVHNGWGWRQRCFEGITSDLVVEKIRDEDSGPYLVGKKISDGRSEKNRLNLFANMSIFGGGERSVLTLMDAFRNSHDVHFYPTEGKIGNDLKELTHSATEFVHEKWINAEMAFERVLVYLNDLPGRIEKNQKQWRNMLRWSECVLVVNYIMSNLHKMEWLSESVKKIIFLNETKRKEWVKRVKGTLLEKIVTVSMPPPVILDSFLSATRRAIDNDIVIGYISSSVGKFPDEAVGVFEKLSKLNNVRFRIMPAHKAIREKFSSDSRFEMHPVRGMDVVEFFAGCDLLLYPVSVNDQGPRVIVEAMATGLPCISGICDGAKDRIVHGVTGFVAKDYDEMTAYAEKLVADRGLLSIMSSASREKALGWTVSSWVHEINSSYTKVNHG